MAEKKKGQQKKAGTHQPRDADSAFGQSVQKPGEAKTSGDNVQKPGENSGRQEERQQGDDYRRRDTYHEAKKGHYRRRRQRGQPGRERTKKAESRHD